MKNQFSKIHPELEQIAKKIPKFSFSKNNLWLVNLLMHLVPSPKTLGEKGCVDVLMFSLFASMSYDTRRARSYQRLKCEKPA